jgi:parallel beta-helix repeat protein
LEAFRGYRSAIIPARSIAISCALFASAGWSAAATYHVNPATGSMSHPGSAAQPWSTLEAVFAANRSFAPGDEILLHDGYHGAPVVKGSNAGTVSIRPSPGARPRLKNLVVRTASRWDIAGLDIGPENESPGAVFGGTLVEIESSASKITFRDSQVRGGSGHESWSRSRWDDVGRGIRVAGTEVTVAGNLVEATSFALTVRRTGSFATIRDNLVRGFSHDGIQALADDCLFEGNTVTDAYISDNSHNHDDFFQSWSVNSSSTPGEGTVSRVTVRGNLFISRTDPAQLLPSNPQGIGLFDGYYQDWRIENNIIASRTSHGIAIYGAIDCEVVNNTVVENPLDAAGGSTRPWIKIAPHKTRAQASSGNLVRNNISARPVDAVAGSSVVDHHHTTTAYGSYFLDPAGFDFSLKATSPARDAGNVESAPTVDITGGARAAPYDLGAHEYRDAAASGPTYTAWLLENDLPADASGDGAKTANPSGDGVVNEMKFALGLPVGSPGHGGRVTTGVIDAGGERYLSLTFTCPQPPPQGVVYEVKSGPALGSWSAGDTVLVADIIAGGLRTRTYRDVVPIGSQPGSRFILLEATAP